MRILIACESSGVVREAFRSMGHDAWSCDLLPADDGSEFHIQGDALEAVRGGEWDALGFHPPCTYLSVSGIHWNGRGRGWERTDKALQFVRDLIAAAGDRPFYLENPVSIISTRIAKPAQAIQPYEFGEDASKKTCLWLKGFKPLEADPAQRVAGRIVEWPRGSGKFVERWANQTDSGQKRLSPGADRWKARSRTYAGIARAMAQQWG
ncbi:MAG: DNA cytosine methyltransferase [Herbaspirillum huttiense]|uniref:DNA cytosine methyltransferase n=1 Tax=Herbaspirillum huttiense TaxID=863372 RepID=UPI001AD2CF3B|nr:DNA cytosine methyltransferase [Herbaspirillum huttiense]MBN9357527.1 DNA cytosine methyltransferase [Herbaspirillum huttiense]